MVKVNGADLRLKGKWKDGFGDRVNGCDFLGFVCDERD